jgi:bifunctional enzyme CysN/CysC
LLVRIDMPSTRLDSCKGTPPASTLHVAGQALAVSREARAALKTQQPCVVWFTGLSGAGKSTIANLVETELLALSHHAYLLDGDNVRRGLNRDLGFTPEDRAENVRRLAEVARLMMDAGLLVLVACISPMAAERRMARALVGTDEFIEVYVDTPLAVAEARDPKGLYKKARLGELKDFTGIGSPYEPPANPDLRIDTTRSSAAQACEFVLDRLRRSGAVRRPRRSQLRRAAS